MSLRARLTLVLCVTVTVAVVAVSVLGLAAVRRQLLSEVDRQLEQRADLVARSNALDETRARLERFGPLAGNPRRVGRALPPVDPFADVDTSFQVIDASGAVLSRPGENSIELPVDEADRRVATEPEGASTKRTVRVDGSSERMLTVSTGNGTALQLSRSLEQTNDTMAALIVLFAAVGAVVIGVAVVSGLVITRRSLQPIRRLTDAAEEIARTQDVSTTIPESGTDEVGRLSAAFNQMLHTLATAREQQRQLVADASHELRTPLTALRTNIEVLSRAAERGRLDDADTKALMADVRTELEALSLLVTEIVDLATDVATTTDDAFETVDLGALVEAAAQRATRRYGVAIDVDADGAGSVTGVPRLLDRAVANLFDNAAKWDRSGRSIEATVRGGRVEVRDHGPGLAGADPARVFDRFYRGPATQSAPGSGLGLAIVAQVVERHGGRVFAADAPDGGAVVGFELPDS
jgi:two-component system sensor histidine kinase MprB